MRSRSVVAVAATVGALVVTSLGPASAIGADWTQVATGSLGGISGLAPADSGWIVARDNKSTGQNRIALLSDSGQITALTWPGTAPQDLESLTTVPGDTGQYAALTSKGTGYLFTISGSAVAVSRSFAVPKGTSNIEAFRLQQVGSQVVALWATRGSSTTPAKLFTSTFAPPTATFGKVATAKVTVPYPKTSAREIADVVVVGTRVVTSATSDPGANGPFASALYDVGAVAVTNGRAVVTLQTPQSLGTYPGHKVEGLACSGTTGLLGSDDEKQGGWVRTDSFCG